MTHKVIIGNQLTRDRAKMLIDRAPPGYVLSLDEPKRTLDQNARLWAMLTDVSIAKPLGRRHTPEMWKCLFMQACSHEVQFLMGLDGNPFPVGFSSSRLSKSQMADLITFIQAFGDENGVRWSEPKQMEAA